jgi:hypothetical protein
MLPFFRCGDVWLDGIRLGRSSCKEKAKFFYLLDTKAIVIGCQQHDPKEVYLKGKSITKVEAVKMVMIQLVMNS